MKPRCASRTPMDRRPHRRLRVNRTARAGTMVAAGELQLSTRFIVSALLPAERYGYRLGYAENGAHRTGKSRPIASLSQHLAQLELHTLAGPATVADIEGVTARKTMPFSQIGKSSLRQSLRD